MEIRRLLTSEYPILIDFLRNYWSENHSLIKSKSLLDFQHLDGDYYNFLVAIEDKKIYSLLGFITTSQYDDSLKDNRDCWGAIWKTIPGAPDGIGIQLMYELWNNYGAGSFGSIGISSIAKKIYKILGLQVEYLHHYYMVNNTIDKYNICLNMPANNDDSKVSPEWTIRQTPNLVKSPDKITYRPQKTLTYFINRYQNHPIYKYFFWEIYNKNTLISIWAIRRIIVNGASVYRIVDVLGDINLIPNISTNIREILMRETIEYVDILNYGIPKEVFANIGFEELDHNSDIIVPNYFEPYEQKNVIVSIAPKSDFHYVAFKGDADQDRPNVL